MFDCALLPNMSRVEVKLLLYNQVHYRHSNFRRMPMTTMQEKWVEDIEVARVKRGEEMSKKLFDDRAAKAVAQKGKADKGLRHTIT